MGLNRFRGARTTSSAGEGIRPLVLALLLAAAAGCATPNRAYRPSTEALRVSVIDLENAEGRRRVARTSLERHESFTLGIVEFDDQGYYWDRRQADALIDEIRREAAGPGDPAVVVNVFVHGWRHTADVCDASLCCYREVLGHVARQQAEVLARGGSGRRPMKIFGVFVGWGACRSGSGRSNTSPSFHGRTWRRRSARVT